MIGCGPRCVHVHEREHLLRRSRPLASLPSHYSINEDSPSLAEIRQTLVRIEQERLTVDTSRHPAIGTRRPSQRTAWMYRRSGKARWKIGRPSLLGSLIRVGRFRGKPPHRGFSMSLDVVSNMHVQCTSPFGQRHPSPLKCLSRERPGWAGHTCSDCWNANILVEGHPCVGFQYTWSS